MDIKLNKTFEYKDLPDMKSIMDEVDKIASETTLGETLFMRENNVKSEGEYKLRMAKKGHVMKHSHIGWNSWDITAKGTEYIYNELKKRGSYIDRFGYCLDWIMGVPEDKRHLLPVGTGLIFKNKEEWARIGQVVPVQPHLGDHMIGSLNSLENTRFALEAGVTTIGNVSHYFTYEYPGIEMEKERVIDMIKGIALMGKFRDQGTIIHSNVDDGFGAQFHDLANLVGWCIIERYIVEDLLGGGMSHCYGNLFSDPILRITFNMAMEDINKTNTPGSMVYGNTIDFGFDYDRNFGALASFSMADAMCQKNRPSGYAITAIPVTEAVRIPTADEIIQAHMTVDMMIEKSEFYAKYIDWKQIEADKNLLVACGNIFFERVINGLDDIGIDINHAGEVLAALKAIGASQLEEKFGVGKLDKLAMRGRIPVYPTNIVKTINTKQEKITDNISDLQDSLKGHNIIVGSTDVHEFGKEIVKGVLLRAGATIFDLGSNVPIQEIVDTVIETESKVIAMSTFNGIALSYAKDLLKEFSKNDLDCHIIMGGLLNENKEGSDIPVDVSEELRKLGINSENNVETIVETIISI